MTTIYYTDFPMKYATVQPTSAPAKTCGDERENEISDSKKAMK